MTIKPLLLLASLGYALVTTLPAAAQSQTATENQDPQRDSLAVTVYNNDLGVVREVRRFDIPNGAGEIRLRDVPSEIDPTTVRVTPAHPNNVEVIEQNYQYDLVSQQKLLQKYIDKTITIIDDKGAKIEGTLLAAEQDRLTLSTPNGITMLTNLARYSVNVPSLPGGLITKPTLVWKLDADKNLSREPLDISYQTGGMNWHAEYIATLSSDDKALDLNGWVSIENNSGAAFNDAKLKLIAGDLHSAASPRVRTDNNMDPYIGSKAAAAPQFQEHGMFEYHVYDLGRKASLANNEVKQISLLEATGITAKKTYTYTGGRNAAVSIEFENSAKNHLGMPLPMGTIRVMKHDKDGSMQFVGEDHINHTARDEKVTLKVGDAFDVLGERKITKERSGSNYRDQTVEITLKNRKDENVVVDVTENLGSNWKISDNTLDYEKLNAYQVVFHVPVKANSETKLYYTVENTW